MSLLAPLWLVAAGLAAAGVVVAHLFSTSVPQREVLPTARFIPEGAPLAVMRTRRITDWLLLAVRLLAVGLLGLALAGAHVPRKAPARVLLVDWSRAVALAAEVRDSARAFAQGAVIIAFDSSPRHIAADSLDRIAPSNARGSLSAALVAAHRALVDATAERDKAELVIVSPLVEEEVDSATSRIAALWDGPIRVVRVRAAAATPVVRAIRAVGDDPIAAVIPRSATRALERSEGTRNLQADVRVIRRGVTRSDSVWARDSAGALVLWPAVERAARPDTAGGVAAGNSVVVAPFARTREPQPGKAIAQWADGRPAATEHAVGRGCIRDVAIPVDPVGDVALRASFRGIVDALTEPCGGARNFGPAALSESAVRGRNQSARPFSAATAGRLPLLLGFLALAALLAEQRIRSRRRAA